MPKFDINISVDEVMRYAMCKTLDEQSTKQMRKAIQKMEQIARQHVHFIVVAKDDALIEAMCRQSQSLQKHLESCHHVIIMAVTLGVGVDRQLRIMQNQDMGDALWLNAAANAYVEALCDALNDHLMEVYANCNQYLSDRFSCGYGDLALTWQKEIVEHLDGSKRLGLYVNESMMLCPEKSVTALIGISDEPQCARIRGCRYCARNGNCEFQKGGIFCG